MTPRPGADGAREEAAPPAERAEPAPRPPWYSPTYPIGWEALGSEVRSSLDVAREKRWGGAHWERYTQLLEATSSLLDDSRKLGYEIASSRLFHRRNESKTTRDTLI